MNSPGSVSGPDSGARPGLVRLLTTSRADVLGIPSVSAQRAGPSARCTSRCADWSGQNSAIRHTLIPLRVKNGCENSLLSVGCAPMSSAGSSFAVEGAVWISDAQAGDDRVLLSHQTVPRALERFVHLPMGTLAHARGHQDRHQDPCSARGRYAVPPVETARAHRPFRRTANGRLLSDGPLPGGADRVRTSLVSVVAAVRSAQIACRTLAGITLLIEVPPCPPSRWRSSPL